MLVDELWRVFENSGNIEAYLYYKKHYEIAGEMEGKVEKEVYPTAVNEE